MRVKCFCVHLILFFTFMSKAMEYGINLNKISLHQFKLLLQDKQLSPSRRLLLKDLDDIFSVLALTGIKTLNDLAAFLKTKQKVSKAAVATGIDEVYLTQLAREAKSYITKWVRLSEFPGIADDIAQKLAKEGVKQSKQFFERVNAQGVEGTAKWIQVHPDKVYELYCLCDLSRIWGVGPVFARIVFDAGVCSVADFAKADPVISFKKYKNLNDEMGYTNAKFTEDDIRMCIQMTRHLEV